jgi:hypothetical protein
MYAFQGVKRGPMRIHRELQVRSLWHPPSVRGCQPILRIGQECSTHFSKGVLYVDHSNNQPKGPYDR